LIVNYNRPIRCTDTTRCADTLLTQAETRLGLVLHADTEDQKGLEGSLSITHKQNDHLISIEIYEVTRDRLKRPDVMPTNDEIWGAIP